MFCGIDIGTTNIKFLLFDEDFKVVFNRRIKTPIIRDEVSGDFLSAEGLFDEIIKSFQAIPENFKPRIKGIGISSMGETVFPISKDGRVLSDGMMWYNNKVLEDFEDLLKKISPEAIFKKTGLWPSWIYSVFKMKNFYRKRPEISSRIYKWLDVSSFLAFLLTGHIGMDKSLSSRTLLVNIETGQWDEELLEISKVPREHLPEIMDCGLSRGRIKEEIARITGISKTAVVTTAGQDHITAAYAAGVHDESKVLNSSGTSEAILWTVGKNTIKRYIDSSPKIFQAGLHCIPERYYILGGIPTGNFCIDWLINKVLKTDYSILENFKYKKNSIFFFPYLRGVFDKSDLGGAFFNLKDHDDQNSIISTVLESLAFEVKSYLDGLKELRLTNYEIMAVGGGTRLKESLKIKANVLKVPVKTITVYESTAFGAALISAIAAGYMKDWSRDFDSIIKTIDSTYFYPNQESYFEEKYTEYVELKRRLYDL